MKLRDDLPTLRMMTLRRLLATVPQPLVVEASTEVAAVEAGLREKRAGVAVVVDNGGVLRGKEAGPTLYMGFGNDDKLEPVDKVLAAALPKDRVFHVEGDHASSTKLVPAPARGMQVAQRTPAAPDDDWQQF